jgi:xanthine/uracil permease
MAVASRQPAGGSPAKSETGGMAAIFDIGFNERLSFGQALILGLQNVFGMTGMFVFPGLLGRAFNLSPEQIAYLYGMSFATCGIITILQSVLLLRLPIIQDPMPGISRR